MKIYFSIVLLLLAAPISSGAEPSKSFSVGHLKEVMKSYLDVEGKEPAPDDPAKAAYIIAFVHGMIAALETADVVLEHKQPILEHLKKGDPKRFFADFDEYLRETKNIADDADGYRLISHFLFTNYTENAALKIKMAPVILDVLKAPVPSDDADKGKR